MSIAPAREEPEITLSDACDHLSRIKHLVEAIFMAAFDIGDKTDAIQHVIICVHNEIDQLEGMLEAIREGESK